VECSKHVLVFAKNNVVSRVKTRLGAIVGFPEASRIYHQLCLLTRQCLHPEEYQCYIYFSEHISDEALWSDARLIRRVQKGLTLGERMFSAFEDVFLAGPKSPQDPDFLHKVIIIGTDCPYLTPEIISESWASLDTHDLVIGPAKDGGYYLLGMKHLQPALFALPEWSTSYVLRQTCNIAAGLGLTIHLLPELEDIDTADDWKRYQQFCHR
jgi:rSAM/selenodomain-associated transferase 1